MSHRQDLPQDNLDRALATAERPDLLRQLVHLSRSAFGVHTCHYPHTLNYPWAASRLEDLPSESRLLEIGAGVNPLPLFLAEKGMFVDCVDSSDFTRTLPPGDDWNEWGYFDYSTLHSHLASYNVSATDFEASEQYDAIYCISVIALHADAGARGDAAVVPNMAQTRREAGACDRSHRRHRYTLEPWRI